MNQRYLIKKIVIVFVVGILVMIGYFVFSKKYLGLFSNTTTKVTLLDAYSGQQISNTAVTIYSDNGIRCIMAPCPTEEQEWTGKSDDQGVVSFPSGMINVNTHITAAGYRSGRNLGSDGEKISYTDRILELDPDSKTDNRERRFKLIDSQSKKSLANVSMWITNNQNCKPPHCSGYIFSGNTNSIGNIYFPISLVTSKGATWVFVDGYKPAKAPVGLSNFEVILEKEP